MGDAVEKILVIKLGALGDVILALGAMEAIRKHHPQARITLLTTRPFVDLMERSGYVDDIIIDSRPKIYDVRGWFFLFRQFSRGKFTRIYDLQMNDRTATYRRLFLSAPEWSGVGAAGDLVYTGGDLKSKHAFDRHKIVLEKAGIPVHLPDVGWMKADISTLGVTSPYVLFVPGSAPTRPEKRWPAVRYAGLARKLMRDGYQVVLLGARAESDVTAAIARACPGVVDLTGRTSLYDVAALARGAAATVGNDTGPVHLTAVAGCPTVALFCLQASVPEKSAPVGVAVQVLAADDMTDISVDDVYKTVTQCARQAG